ncbi:MAG: hypothetical protein KC503_01675 [Myxococcales bacterium]|nr:hypothetical protein [Myxococcales bacterium]
MRAVRPRYEERFDVSTETALARAKVMLTAEGGPFEGNVLDRFVDIHIRQADRHFWSPWLNVEVEPLEGEQTGCFVHGRFGPHPNVWTLFMMLYGVLSMLSFAALMWGLSQLMAGEYAWTLWGLPPLFLLATLLYFASQVGQRLAAPQTELIIERLTAALRGADAPAAAPSSAGNGDSEPSS